MVEDIVTHMENRTKNKKKGVNIVALHISSLLINPDTTFFN